MSSYFDKHLRPVVSPSSDEKGEAHSLFKLTHPNDGQLHLCMHLEMGITALGLKVSGVGF